MIRPPQPRFRFYNGLKNYRIALHDVALRKVFRGEAVQVAERRIADWLDVPEVILTAQGRYGISHQTPYSTN